MLRGSTSRDWNVTQCFGGNHAVEDLLDGDVVTAVEFDETGDYLAVGDKAGRIWIYESAALTKDSEEKESGNGLDYKFYGQFQSHEPEFDYLKSLEIEEKINMIKWCGRQNEALILLAANDKTIKLWKIYERKIKKLSNMNMDSETFHYDMTVDEVRIPDMTYYDTVTAATPRRIYQNAHAYHINSISINSDGETYISADDLRINLWNLNVSESSFVIVDIKPSNMEELTEVITSASFHPKHCNILMYSTSRGSIKLTDLRTSAQCDSHCGLFEHTSDAEDKSFFSEIISSISDVTFTPDGTHLVARDYLSLKIWDIRNDSQPLKIAPIHTFLSDKLCDLYENDCIFDKFEVASSRSGTSFVTGTYGESFIVYDWKDDETQLIHATKPSQPRSKQQNSTSNAVSKKRNKSAGFSFGNTVVNPDSLDFNKKALHVVWHPHYDAVAVACLNNLYVYQKDSLTGVR